MEDENLIAVEVLDPFENVDVYTDIVSLDKKDVTLKDIKYLCDHVLELEGGCEFCPLSNGRNCGYAILLKTFGNNENELRNEILNWLRENPPTSFLMDIREKLPNIELKNKIPTFCVKSIYGQDCCSCEKTDKVFDVNDMYCRKCWRLPMDKSIQN